MKRIFLSLFRDDPEYDLSKQRLLGMGIEIRERGDLEWAAFAEPMGANQKIGGIMEGKTVSQIEGSHLYPGIVCRDGRAYFIVNYTKEARDKVLGRLEGFVKACSEVFGPKCFSIDHIDEPKGYYLF